MDETEEKNKTTEENSQDENSVTGEDNQAPASDEDDLSRMDRAKAWMRAMHAGDDLTVTDGDQPADLRQMEAEGLSSAQADHLESELREAQAKAQEAESLYKRMAADFENYRRRTDREREEFQAAGVKKMAEAIFPALDDMDRAISSMNAEMDPEKLMEGLNIICNRIYSCLEQAGIKPLESIGQEFDPRFHEPVQQVETTEFPDGVVMQELRRGFMLNDVVVRPSLVNVASNESGVVEKPAGQDANEGESSDTEASDQSSETDGTKVYNLDDVEEEAAEDIAENTDAPEESA